MFSVHLLMSSQYEQNDNVHDFIIHIAQSPYMGAI